MLARFPSFWKLVQRTKPLARRFNRYAIDQRVSFIEPRPNPCGRRPSTPSRGLFTREGDTNDKMIECPKSTVLLSFFAQWLTDGFLRTARPKRGDPPLEDRDTRTNESNHEIDLAQLYGLGSAATDRCA